MNFKRIEKIFLAINTHLFFKIIAKNDFIDK